jgi:predicted ATPase/DNA-binding SARP family transcriptional activator
MRYLPRTTPTPNIPGDAEYREDVSDAMLGTHAHLSGLSQTTPSVGPHSPTEIPLVRSLNGKPQIIPIPLSSFIGRAREIADVKRMLAATRLLTLTGAGGCGKTRLAMQVSTHLMEEYGDGVVIAELGALTDQMLVPQAIATALNVREQLGYSLLESITNYLHFRELLLVLDSCEHLIEACAQIAEVLLSRCPKLRILATSREALGIAGETAWLVPSLSLPDLRQSAFADMGLGSVLHEYEATRLFLERASNVLPSFTLTSENAVLVAQICRRLDGIPLAIELAAARVKVLSLEQIAARLDDCFRLLTVGSRTALPRHQTLQATMDWSYGLLWEQEQILFRRLSVFAGSFTLEAAEAICAGEELRQSNVLDLLSRLVDKSLVVVEQSRAGASETSYRLLETIRQYAAERLQEAGETSALHTRHRDWCLRLAERAEPELLGPEQGRSLERLEQQHDNLRAALKWSKEQQNGAEAELRLAGALGRFWYLRGYWSEGRGWLEGALARTKAGDRSAEQAKALSGAGGFAWLQGDSATAIAQLEESASIRRELGDKWSLAFVIALLGVAALYQNDPAEARARLEESVMISREIGDKWDLAFALNSLGHVPHAQGDYAAARALFEESVAIWRDVGDKWGLALALHDLGWTALCQGDYQRAALRSEESLALSREHGSKEGVAWALQNLGYVAQLQGDYERAKELLKESLALLCELGNKLRIALCLVGLAGISSAEGQLVRAVRLCGAAESLLEVLGAPLPPVERSVYESAVTASRGQLEEETFAMAWAEGRAMKLEQIIAYALAIGEEQQTTQDPKDSISNRRPASIDRQVVEQPALRIVAFGPAYVYRGKHALTSTDWTYAKASELLFYLLCNRSATKEQIGLALWPDASPSQLRNSFRVTLYHLRRALGRPDWIIFENDRYAFNHTLDYWFDVEAFETNMAEARQLQLHSPSQAIPYLQQAVKLYGGDLLEDLVTSDWHLLRQEELRRQYLEALLTLGQLLFAEERYREAADTYRQAIAHDSYLESAHRELMRCYVRLGERGQALRHYQGLLQHLRDELDSLPDPETTALFERLSRGDEV